MSTVLQTGALASPATGATLVFGANTAAGSKICIGVRHNGATVSFTDSQGNTYAATSAFVSLSGTFAVQYFVSTATSAAALTLTITFPSGAVQDVFAAELPNRHATPWVTPAEASNGSTDIIGTANGAATNQVTGTFTPPSDDCYIMVMMRTDATGSITPPAGFTERIDALGCYVADMVQTTAAAINPTCVNGGTPTVGDCYAGLFKAAAGGGGGSANKIAHGLVNGGLVNGGLLS